VTARERPGPELTDAERLSALLGEAADKLAWLLECREHHAPTLREAWDTVQFVRKQLIQCIPAEIDHGQTVAI
jgi:hypothetical protein